MIVVMAMTTIIMTPRIVMIAMGHAISTRAASIPMVPMVAMIPITIRIADRDITKVDGDTCRSYRACDRDRRTCQRKRNYSAFK